MSPLLAFGVSGEINARFTLLVLVIRIHPLNLTEFRDEAFPGSAQLAHSTNATRI